MDNGNPIGTSPIEASTSTLVKPDDRRILDMNSPP